MAWLVVEDDDGTWENIALDGVDSVSFDGKGTTYVMRKGLPPKGVKPRVIFVADEPVLTRPSLDPAALKATPVGDKLHA